MATELRDGQIDAKPVACNNDVCSYCPYICICGYENDNNQTAEKLNRQEIFKKMLEDSREDEKK